MKNTYVVAVLFGVFLAGSASVAVAQGGQEGQLVRITEIHVKPGMRVEFEAGRERVIARWAEHGFSFPGQMSVNEQGVYRLVAITGGWEDFERRRQEVQAMPGNSPAAFGAVDHIRQSVLVTRPELAYATDNPRLPGDEAGFLRYVFIYLRPGTGDQAAEIMTKYSALYRRHNVGDSIIVASSVVGYDAPMLLLRFEARDVEDNYAQNDKNNSMLGDEGADLRRQMGALARRIEPSNNVWRRDLSYQPAN